MLATRCRPHLLRLPIVRHRQTSAAAEAALGRAPGGVQALISKLDEWEVPVDRLRNFCIVAHVDHGKSTIADRLLEVTDNILPATGDNQQVLDSLQVERERGVTVKAHTASLLYHREPDSDPYVLNLIDTPGHVDFSYEVSRALAACEGALLLVDCAQGVQAQTVANFNSVKAAGLDVIPVLTKIDLPTADPELCLDQMQSLFGFDMDNVLWTSAKSGEGVEELLPAVVDRLRPPDAVRNAPLRVLLFDSWYDEYRGVVCIVHIVDGVLEPGTSVIAMSSGLKYGVQEVGLVTPARYAVDRLRAGQVGYVILGMKSTREAKIGDTFSLPADDVEALPGFQPVKPMVFASVYPVDTGDFSELEAAVSKLLLNDASVTSERETSASLGMGLREIFLQRLQTEFDTPVISTAPSVPYTLELTSGEMVRAEKPSDFPSPHLVAEYLEPMVKASIITPQTTLGPVMRLLQDRRGTQHDIVYLDSDQVALQYDLPWQEVVTDFFDRLKSISSGYASFDYEPGEERAANVSKVDILLNKDPLHELSFVAHRDNAVTHARAVCQKLRSVIDRQQFEIVIQAAVGAKIVARERIPPFRKDVLIKSGKLVGGGDITRKKKLLEKQKKGKARMKTVGRVQLPQSAFHSVVSR